jgi:autotransporter-associated beta strand protein
MKMTAMRAPFVSQKRLAKSRIKQACFQVHALESRICLSVTLSNSVWTPIGPAGLNNGSSGRVTALAADPSNPNIYYAGAAGGGVWKTTDGGSSWEPLTDSQATLNTGAIAVAPNNPNVIYVGTGEADNSPLAYYGRGVLVSTNGGATWTLTGNTGTPNFNQRTISQIAVDPTNSQIAYVAVTAVGQNTGTNGTGIFKTTNGGTSWTNTTATISGTAPFTDIKIDPANSQHLLAAVGGGVTPSGVYVSTNGGTSWVAQGGGLPTGTSLNWTRVAFAPSNSQVIYATFANTSGSLASAWITSNGGTSWTQLTATPNFLNGQGNYATTLIVDPKNPNIVYAGGGSGTNSFIETTNSGASWTDISTAITGTSPHSMHHAIAVDATGRVIDGNDGGVWRLDNSLPGAQAWTNITSNLQIGEMLGGALDPTNPTNNAFAGNQGNAVNQFTGGLVWTARDSSDSGAVRIDSATTPLTVYRQVPSSSSFGSGGIFRKSTDGGVTWANATTGITTTDPQSTYDPFVVDPNNGNHVFFGTNRVYETTTAGGTWTPISTTNTNGWTTTSAIVALAVAPSATGTIYASAGGSLFSTTNDGAAWSSHTSIPAIFTNLFVDPSNSLICYGISSSFVSPQIFKSTDGGGQWTNISGNLPANVPAYSLALNTAANTMYLGTDNGVYATTNGGTSWAPFGTALPNVQVRDLQYYPSSSTLAAFTLGRGVFEISTSLPNNVVVNTAVDETTAGDGLTSLREAVTQLSGTGGNITFDPSLAGQTLNLAPAIGNISIPNNINIIGLANRPTISGGGVALEIASGATVNLSNLIISGAGTVLQVDSTAQPQLSNVTITGNITDGGALTFNQVVNDTLTGNISGTGSLTKIGSQTLTLVGTNSYTGGTFVSAGTLQGNTNALVNIWTVNAPGIIAIDESSLPGAAGTFNGAISGSGTLHVTGTGDTLTLSNTATITLSGSIGIDAADIFVPTATNNLNATATLWLGGTLNLGGFSQTVGGLSGGPSALVYNVSSAPSPTATLTVGGDNRYSVFAGLLENVPLGSTNSGILAIQKTLPGILTLPTSNTFTGGLTLSGGTLNLNNATAVGTGRLTLAGGTLDNNTLGSLTLTNNNPETWSGNFTFNGTAPLNLGTGAVTMTVSPIITINNNTLTVPGAISGAQNLTKSGPGNLLLSGANNYTGGTTINAGTLTGNTTSLQGGFGDGSVLIFDQTIGGITDGTFTGNINGAGAITFANGTVRLASSSVLRNFGATTVLGKLVGPVSGGLNALSNISSYDVEGTLDLGASSQTIASLFGAGTVYHFQPVGQPSLATLTLGGDDSSTVFTGTILDTQPASGNGGIIAVNKLGQGIFTLTGANTFTGGLTVSAGTLGVGPSPASSDPMGAGTVTLNGGDMVLNGRLGATTQQIVPDTGYNQDLVVEAPTLPANAVSVTTGTVDSTYVWYEKGYNSQNTTGLPIGAAAFTSATNPAVSFQLQPYSGNNVAFINGNAGSVMMTLNTPTAFSTLNVLAASANGNAALVAQLNFADGSSVFTQFSVTDWFNTTVTNTAYTAGGRAARSTGVVTLTPNQGRLFEYDLPIPATSQNKLLTSINFTEASGSQVGIYGLSGAAMSVPAVQSYANAVQVLSPANIDVEGSLTASLGNLSIAGTQLTLTGPASSSLAFGPTTLTGNATFNPDTGTSLSLGAVGETSGPRNLTKIGPGTLTLTAADSYTGTTTVSTGNLVANVTGALPINGPVSIGAMGTVTLAQSSPSFTTTTGLITIANGGVLNISNNTLFINYGAPASDPITQVRQQLTNGYNAGTWTGAASASSGTIRSSAAALNPGTYNVGYADSADGSGVNTTPNSIEVKYTLNGDANLNGSTDIFDLNILLPHFNGTGVWTGGDFTYNGNVDIFDLNALLPNFNQTLPATSPAAAPRSIPATSPQTTAPTPALSAATLFAPGTSKDQPPRRSTRRSKKLLP